MKTFIKKYSSKKKLLSFSMFLIAFILPFEKTTIRYALVIFLTLYFFYGDYKELLNKKKMVDFKFNNFMDFTFYSVIVISKNRCLLGFFND